MTARRLIATGLLAARTRVGWLERQLLSLRADMTPGQRWTATLAVLLACAVALLGTPREPVLPRALAPASVSAVGSAPPPPTPLSPALESSPGDVPKPSDSTLSGGVSEPAVLAAPRATTPVADLPPQPTTTPAAASTATPARAPGARAGSPRPLASTTTRPGAAGASAAPDTPQAEVTAAPAPLSGQGGAVLLARSGDGQASDRDDAAIARAFAAQTGWSTAVLAADGDAAATCALARTARVAAAATELSAPLRTCLVQQGTTVLTVDGLGTSLATAPGAAVLSLRRGDRDTLGELGSWGVSSGALAGPVGVVGDADRRALLEPALDALRTAGAAVVAVAWLRADSAAEARAASTDFAAKGVRAVVMAAPVATQRLFVTAAAAPPPPWRYVVSDVADAVLNESYPPVFDGARAHTSLSIPWSPRDHGSTAQQRACDATWQARATPAVTLPGEQPRVYAWCALAQVLARASIAAVLTRQDPIGLLATLRGPSPLTSDVGPVRGGWGPVADAVLTWRASCSCWQEQEPFVEATRARSASGGGRAL